MKPDTNQKSAFPFCSRDKFTEADFGVASDTLDIFQDIFGQHEKLPEKLHKSYLNVKAQEILFESLQQLSSGYGPGSVVLRYDHDEIAKARDYILEHLQEPLSLPDLAFVTGLNKDKLEKGFRDLYGTTVHAFISTKKST